MATAVFSSAEVLDMAADERYLSVPQVADVFEVSEAAVRQWYREGILQGYALPGKRQVVRIYIWSIRQLAEQTRAPQRLLTRLDEAINRNWVGDERAERGE